MKKFKSLRVLGVLSILCLCGVQANAASGYIPCVGVGLSKDQKTVTSEYKMLDASYMYGETMSSSKYKVLYEAKGSNNAKSWKVVKDATYDPGKSGKKSITTTNNYYKITLTGKKGNKNTKKCIAFGKVSE